MTAQDRAWYHNGLPQAGVALALASATAGVIAASSWAQSQIPGRLSTLGVTLFAIALLVGSRRFVGLTTVPVLGGALIASAVAAEPAWHRSIALGCLWYVAVELGWEAIERRDGAERTSAYDNRRIHEIATVVLLSLATTTGGFLFSFLAPVRTMAVVGLVFVVLLTAMSRATRHLKGTGSGEQAVSPSEFHSS